MKTLQEKIETILKDTEKQHSEAMAKFTANVEFQFAWVGEEVYKTADKIKQLKNILVGVTAPDSKLTEARIIEYLAERIMGRTSLMDRSSDQLHALVSLWSKEVTLEIIGDIKFKF